MAAPITDLLGRPLKNLRLSVTDRCNLRCSYCMPEAEYVWLPRHDLLQFEEMSALVDVFTDAGVDKIRLTGGEPLLRRDLPDLVRMLAQKPAIRDLALTTNGVALAAQAHALREAGLHRITVSLDTLQPDRFRALTRFDALPQVLAGIDEASRHFPNLKLDAVVIRGATQWTPERVVSRQEMLALLSRQYGQIAAVLESSSAPADRFRLPDGTVFGIISSTTDPFCRSCDRSRLTADGMWYRCLYATSGTDLRTPLRAGMSQSEILAMMTSGWEARADRGAEERLAVRNRAPLVTASSLKNDPHLEMHTRGG
jgi:cyclic pyranopterin phosphate synthase